MRINSDLGESYGRWRLGNDEALMAVIDDANIACGYHAGDPLTLRETLLLAARHGVRVGAHPAYPDLQGFGRRSLSVSAEELVALLHYQLGALEGMALACGTRVDYMKPHGALYNDLLRNEGILHAVLDAVAGWHRRLPLVVQAGPWRDRLEGAAAQRGVDLLWEAFADRRYEDDGALRSRREPDAVLDGSAMVEQARRLLERGEVLTASGRTLRIRADTLCVHGDSAHALEGLARLRAGQTRP